MDSKLLLVKAVTLLYRESQLPSNAVENSSTLVKEILSTIKTPEIMVDGDFGRETISALRTTITWMLGAPVDTPFDKHELLQRIRVNVGQEESLFLAVKEGIEEELSEPDVRKACTNYREEFTKYLKKLRTKEIIKAAYGQAYFQEDNVDWKHFVKELVANLEPYQDIEKQAAHSSVVNDFDFNNLESMVGAMSQGQSELSRDGVLRFGIQAINRMFGEAGGIRRGEFLVVGALQHNFKSGFTTTLMKQAALYNTPYMRDPSKKPMIMRISFENKGSDDVYWLYKSLVENETGVEVDISKVDANEAVAYVAEKLQATGYHLNMCRIDPSDFTYHDLFDRINYFESQGFEIHLLVIDYLNMMSKKGCTQGPAGFEVRDLFRRVRNFTAKKGIAVITPHQLSSEAKGLVRMGADNFVQEIANKGYYDSCRVIDQEVDMEIYIHIVKANGESYLTVQRGKHRKIAITRESDLYTVLKFERIGAILDDINGRDTSRKRVGGEATADGGGSAWFDN